MFRTSLLALIIFVSLGVNAQSENWKTYTTKKFTVQYPGSWDFDKSGAMGSSFIVLGPVTKTESKFRPNANLVVQDISRNPMNLDQYARLSEQQIANLITDSKIIRRERITGFDHDRHRILYNGKQGKLELQYEQHFWIVDKKAYILTFTTTLADSQSNKTTKEKIMNSFRFIE